MVLYYRVKGTGYRGRSWMANRRSDDNNGGSAAATAVSSRWYSAFLRRFWFGGVLSRAADCELGLPRYPACRRRTWLLATAVCRHRRQFAIHNLNYRLLRSFLYPRALSVSRLIYRCPERDGFVQFREINNSYGEINLLKEIFGEKSFSIVEPALGRVVLKFNISLQQYVNAIKIDYGTYFIRARM